MVSEEQIQLIRSMFPELSECKTDYIAKVLEAYEESKWVKFDKEDKMKKNTKVIVRGGNGKVTIHDFRNSNSMIFVNLNGITHWQPLPEFKGD